MPKRVFVTVGSTEFPQLIKALLTPKTLGTLTALGYTDLCVQYGTNKQLFEHGIEACHISGLSITGFDYSPSIDDEMKQADLIISHAGSGSLLEALHLQKPVIAVPNESLMDNHQVEVAKALSDEGYLLHSTACDLPDCLRLLEEKKSGFRQFAESGSKRFLQIMDAELGLRV